MDWYKKAADQGHADALGSLADMYIEGNELITKNVEEGLRLYRMSARSGSFLFQYNFSAVLLSAESIPGNTLEAMEWLEASARQGFYMAQRELGLQYLKGDILPEDYALAYAWLNLAAAKGDSRSVELRDRLREILPSSQIADAQRISRELSEGENELTLRCKEDC